MRNQFSKEEIIDQMLIVIYSINIVDRRDDISLNDIYNLFNVLSKRNIYDFIEKIENETKYINRVTLDRDDYTDFDTAYAYNISPEGMDYIQSMEKDYFFKLRNATLLNKQIPINKVDSWQPLPIEDAIKREEGIKLTETAIKEIEADNGYAASHPEERNSILAALRMGLDAIKNNHIVIWTQTIVLDAFKKALTKFLGARIGERLEAAKTWWDNFSS